MIYPSVIHPRAEEELLNIAKNYQDQKEGLGELLYLEFEKAVKFIQIFPEACPVRMHNLRHIITDRFPVLVIYEFENNEIHVYNVIHVARNVKFRYRR